MAKAKSPLMEVCSLAKKKYDEAVQHEKDTIDALLTNMIGACKDRGYDLLNEFDVSQRLDGLYYSKLNVTLKDTQPYITLKIEDRTKKEDEEGRVLYDGWLLDADVPLKKLVFDCLHTSYFKQMHTEQYNLRMAWSDVSRIVQRS